MTQITLHNSRTRRKEALAPIDPADVRMYVCGPTVYDRAHLGNARPVVVFDVLFRLLRHVYGAGHVTYVRNLTDVDDKINARARALQEGGDGRDLNAIIRTLTDETIGFYHADMKELGALRPTHEPRATDYIPQMVAMIEGLVAKGHAYAAEGHVLFAVDSWRAGYGKLSGRAVEDMVAGARVEVAPYKRNPMDFVLWKPSGPDEPGWDSPWGRGRPGWHIECSAMSHALLGESFDIHGGGIDLMFPHHENEIAQSCCAHPEGDFARVWLHNEMVQVDGKKMSKSLGNFFTVRDLLDQGWPGEVIRFVMLQTHYRKPMDWTEAEAERARKTLEGWYRLTEGVPAASLPSPQVIGALAEDLNTPAALAALHDLATPETAEALKASVAFLGLGCAETSDWYPRPRVSLETSGHYGVRAPGTLPEDLVNALGSTAARFLDLYADAKAKKDFTRVDALKARLKSLGVETAISRRDGKPCVELTAHRALSEGEAVQLRHEAEGEALK
ncbi:cysteine--tRNA ligase [Rhodobaculum claviforme]|uniref:Cysteine--tRNA ligase n=1 Tax=Rhodobaculum claviforme TaxID=1549854 RepID=A0A934WHP5_9RHOB|nr:cysteine--tRNA ligase [Rhodobaculum claviforme]MBK5926026.1 cysteine--tRNA ligase [Rhodobaculum claviforme]